MRRAIRTLLILALMTGVMIFGCELLARVILWRSALTETAAPVEFGYSATGLGDLLPNLDSIVRLYPIRPFYLKTNSFGLRNVAEVDPDPAVLRVLVVGDSFTYGMYVHNHEAFPARLEETLNQRLDTRVQVFNAGVPGYTIEDELSYLRDKGLQLEPDLVILGFYTNDVFDLYPPVRQYFARSVLLDQAGAPPPAEPAPLAAFLRANSALYSAWWNARAGFEQGQIDSAVNRVTPIIEGLQRTYQDMMFLRPDDSEFQDEWQGYEWLLRETTALLAERGIPFVVVAFPDLAQMPVEGGLPDVPQRFLARVTADTGTPLLDLLPVFRAAGDVQSLYLMYYNPDAAADPNAPDAAVMMYTGDGHPSPYGHLVTARALADLLVERGLVPR